jgi:hypothetical protein
MSRRLFSAGSGGAALVVSGAHLARGNLHEPSAHRRVAFSGAEDARGAAGFRGKSLASRPEIRASTEAV